MSNRNFICKYCGRPTTITNEDVFDGWKQISIEEPDIGKVGLAIHAVTCPNPECKKLSLNVSLTNVFYNYMSPNKEYSLEKRKWQLLPESSSKVLPEYIPDAIKSDYYEACRIRDLSPKASATLARRCLQGMIRDFWNIKKDTLGAEIKELEDKIDSLVWQGIDAVRSVGNIGAHMEADINTIIDVDPDEAQLLLELIERLIDDWYVDRKRKNDNLDQIVKMADIKKQQKNTNTK